MAVIINIEGQILKVEYWKSNIEGRILKVEYWMSNIKD